ncbi:MAG: M15 family metallopeptidase [Acidimicrobiia bacterium]
MRRLLTLTTATITAATAVVVMAMSSGPAVANGLAPGGTFIDDDGSAHEGSIEAIAAEQITLGCNPPTNDRYCPDQPLTRAQMATFLTHALGLTPSDDDRFSDDNTSIHQADIQALAAAGITLGCNPPTNDRYCPDQPVTRAQLATFLTRALDLTPSDEDRFSDDDAIIHQADIQALAAAGITLGCNPPSNDRYCPDQPVTRAEMATFLTRALGLTPMVPPAGYFARVTEIDNALAARMETSWRPGCPVALSELRYVELDHWDFDGTERRGELVVHAAFADDIVEVFEVLFDQGFPIERMVLVDDYAGDDLASMDANNTSAFNCRLAQGSSRWSEHAYGRAIDINPVQNPYVSGATVLPPAGAAYLDRTETSPGMVLPGDVVVGSFAAIGWEWGGDWVSLKDYQHFSSTGR